MLLAGRSLCVRTSEAELKKDTVYHCSSTQTSSSRFFFFVPRERNTQQQAGRGPLRLLAHVNSQNRLLSTTIEASCSLSEACQMYTLPLTTPSLSLICSSRPHSRDGRFGRHGSFDLLRRCRSYSQLSLYMRDRHIPPNFFLFFTMVGL